MSELRSLIKRTLSLLQHIPGCLVTIDRGTTQFMNQQSDHTANESPSASGDIQTMATSVLQTQTRNSCRTTSPDVSATFPRWHDRLAEHSAEHNLDHSSGTIPHPALIQGKVQVDPSIEAPRNRSLNIAEHSQSELLVMLAALLSKITCSNDNLQASSNNLPNPAVGSPLMAFHARNIPSISIQSYLTRILKYCPMSSDIFLSLLVYFDRMSNAPNTKTCSQHLTTFSSTKQLMGDTVYTFSIDSYNVHRLVITGIVVASKFCSDVFYTNSRYAKVAYVSYSTKVKFSNPIGWWSPAFRAESLGIPISIDE